MKKQKMTTKLELTWPGKNDLSSLSPEPRILIEAPKLSNVALDPNTSNMLFTVFSGILLNSLMLKKTKAFVAENVKGLLTANWAKRLKQWLLDVFLCRV